MLIPEKQFLFSKNYLYLCAVMKKVFTYFATFVTAALVFYGGAGVNLVSYCCNLCRMEGIEAVAGDKCCDIHHHDHSDHSSTDCCSFERISFDWVAHNLSEQDIDFSPFSMDVFMCDPLIVSNFNTISIGKKLAPALHGPPIVLPRDYLSILTVLLI